VFNTLAAVAVFAVGDVFALVPRLTIAVGAAAVVVGYVMKDRLPPARLARRVLAPSPFAPPSWPCRWTRSDGRLRRLMGAIGVRMTVVTLAVSEQRDLAGA
jgi:hypothetical protein